MKQMLVCTGALICAMVTIISSSPVKKADIRQQSGYNYVGLRILSATEHKVVGEYVDKSDGVRFSSETHENLYFLDVTTLNGNPILNIKEQLLYDTITVSLVSLLGTEFLVVSNYSNGNSSIVPYYIPIEFKQLIEDATNKENFEFELLQKLDQESANKKETDALVDLLQYPEINLILQAARALQNSEIEGTETLAAMSFHDTALQLKMAQMKYKEFEKTQQRQARAVKVRVRVCIRSLICIEVEVEF